LNSPLDPACDAAMVEQRKIYSSAAQLCRKISELISMMHIAGGGLRALPADFRVGLGGEGQSWAPRGFFCS